MKYINTFKNHASYEEKLNGGGGVDISLPNISYCEDVKDVHYNPYNTVEFYVGEVTEPQTVSIYTDGTNHVDVTVSEGNKWYSYTLPKDKGLFMIEGDSVKKVVVKADITTSGYTIISNSTIEASFKGSNTSKVTNMASMFESCISLTSLDVSRFNTSIVTNMSNMFSLCSGLTSLDVSNFDTSNVTDIYCMFNVCSGLISLDVSNFDTSNVTDIEEMFRGCASLTSLDVSNFDTSKVIYMNSMFEGCASLTSLGLSNFDTSKVIYMDGMFEGCSNLTSLDLSSWDMSNVTDMNRMFKGCSKLTTIRMVGCSPSTIDKIKAQLKADGLSENIVKQ